MRMLRSAVMRMDVANAKVSGDGKFTLVPCVMTAQGVHNGAYKDAEEIDKAFDNCGSAVLTDRHLYDNRGLPRLADREQDILGITMNHELVMLPPPAGKSVERQAIQAMAAFKNDKPNVVPVLDEVLKGNAEGQKREHVSITYYCDVLKKTGEFDGEAYDYVEKDIIIRDLAVLAIDEEGAASKDGAYISANIQTTRGLCLAVQSHALQQDNEGLPSAAPDSSEAMEMADEGKDDKKKVNASGETDQLKAALEAAEQRANAAEQRVQELEQAAKDIEANGKEHTNKLAEMQAELDVLKQNQAKLDEAEKAALVNELVQMTGKTAEDFAEVPLENIRVQHNVATATFEALGGKAKSALGNKAVGQKPFSNSASPGVYDHATGKWVKPGEQA